MQKNMEKMTSKADQIIDELSKRLLIIEGKVTDILTRDTLENINQNSNSTAIGLAVLVQIGTAATTGFAGSDEGIDVTVFAVEVTDNNNVKHYFKGCFPEVIFKIEDQVKVIAQPVEKNYALAKAVIDIKKNYMWTGQEIARGRMKYRIWGIKLIIYVLIVTAILFALIFYALAGTGGLLFFNDVDIQVTLLIMICLFLFIGWRIGASFDEQSIEIEAILLKLGFNNPTMISLYDYSVFNIMKKNNEKIEGYSTRWADYTYRIDLAKKVDAEKYSK